MKDLVIDIAKALVDIPDEVTVREVEGEQAQEPGVVADVISREVEVGRDRLLAPGQGAGPVLTEQRPLVG